MHRILVDGLQACWCLDAAIAMATNKHMLALAIRRLYVHLVARMGLAGRGTCMCFVLMQCLGTDAFLGYSYCIGGSCRHYI